MANAREILTELNTNALKQKLLEYPNLIYAQKSKVRDAKKLLINVEAEKALIEADIMTEITMENNGNGKPKFSNDKARQVELLKRKAKSAEYSEMHQAAQQAEHQLNEAQDNLERLQDEFKSYRYIIRLTSEELALWAGQEENKRGNG